MPRRTAPALAVIAGTAVALAAPQAARAADGLELGAIGARAIGRAGAGAVSADDGAALHYNPAGLARRGGWRVQLGLSAVDHASTYRTAAADPIVVEERAGPALVPFLSVQGGLGDRVVVGLSYSAPGDRASFPGAPATTSFGDPSRERFPHRYAATGFAFARRGLSAGVALRAAPWLALGAAAGAHRVDLEERRNVWGGTVMPVALDPSRDMTFTASARDELVPALAFGFVLAPVDAPIELGASVTWSADAELEGPATLTNSRNQDPSTGEPLATAEVAPGATATLTLPMPLVARAGARFFASRLTVELGGELVRQRAADPTWQVTGVGVRAEDRSAPLLAVPLATALQDRVAVRAAVDVDVAPGFLLVSAGWAYTTAAVPRRALTTALPDLDAHTLAAGVELYVEGAAVTLGIAHSFGLARTVTAGEARTRALLPLTSGDFAAAPGSYDGATTLIGVGVELSWASSLP